MPKEKGTPKPKPTAKRKKFNHNAGPLLPKRKWSKPITNRKREIIAKGSNTVLPEALKQRISERFFGPSPPPKFLRKYDPPRHARVAKAESSGEPYT